MALKQDIDFQIKALTALYADFIDYNDSIDFTDTNQNTFVVSDTLLSNTQKVIQTSIQELEKQKRESLIEYNFTPKMDTTLYNLCFELYGVINEDNLVLLIDANDFQGINRTDIDPLNPIIKKNTKIIYYK